MKTLISISLLCIFSLAAIAHGKNPPAQHGHPNTKKDNHYGHRIARRNREIAKAFAHELDMWVCPKCGKLFNEGGYCPDDDTELKWDPFGL